MGYITETIWECEAEHAGSLAKIVDRFLSHLNREA